MTDEITLINDAKVARLLSMSPSWVRGQRYKRRHGLPHELAVDPVHIGASPRYVASDVFEWLDGIVGQAREPALA
jgi:predicted DNA-binding transcriptional regulator AlpA